MDREEKNRASQNTTCSERKSKNESSGSEHKHPKSAEGKIKVKPITNKLKDCMNDKKDGTKKDSNVGLISQVSITDRKSFQPKEKLNSDVLAERKNEGKRKVSDVTNKHGPKMSTKGKSSSLKERDLSEEKSGKDKRKEKSVEIRKDLESDDFEMPSMSFEEYLSYDLEAPKRKKRSCESKNPKRIKLDQKQDVKMTNPSMKSGRPITEALTTEVNIHSNYFDDS